MKSGNTIFKAFYGSLYSERDASIANNMSIAVMKLRDQREKPQRQTMLEICERNATRACGTYININL